MDLGEALKTHLGGAQQGQLVIKFAGENHLCKISVEDGQAVYLSLGVLGPIETLDAIVGKTAEWCNFIKGLPVRRRLEQPVTQMLLDIAGAAPPAPDEVPLAAPGEAEVAAAAELVTESTVDPRQIDEMTNRFIDLVGPLGTLLAERICANLAYTNGSSMDATTFSRFVAALSAEVPEEERQSFIDTAAS